MKRFILAVAILLTSTLALKAAPITGVGAVVSNPMGTGGLAVTVPGGAPTAPTFNGTTFNFDHDPVLTDLLSASPTLTNNVIDITANYSTFGELSVPFNTTASGVNHLYRFNVTVNNNTSRPITNFGVRVTSGGATFANPTGSSPAPFSFAAAYSAHSPNAAGFGGTFSSGYNFVSSSQILFGPNSNTGSGVPVLGSTTVSFLLFTGINPPSSFTLAFTANPEPTSLALAGAALAGFGGVVIRRRRSKQSA